MEKCSFLGVNLGYVTPQIDLLGKMSPVLRISTHTLMGLLRT